MNSFCMFLICRILLVYWDYFYLQGVYEAILSNFNTSLLRQPGEEKKEKKEKKEKRVKKKREEDEGGEWEEVTKGAPMIKVRFRNEG